LYNGKKLLIKRINFIEFGGFTMGLFDKAKEMASKAVETTTKNVNGFSNAVDKMTLAPKVAQSATMREVFKSGGLFKPFTFTDNSLIIGRVEYPYEKLGEIRLMSSTNSTWTNGVASVIALETGKEYDLSFQSKDLERFMKTMAYANEKINATSANAKNYKYVLQCHTGSKVEIYDNYLMIYIIGTSIAEAMKNGAKGGASGQAIMFSEITSMRIQGDAFIINNIAIPLNLENAQLAGEISAYIEDMQRKEIQAEMQEVWEPITGIARSFPLAGEIIQVTRSMDIYNNYKERFRELAKRYTDKFEAEYDSKIRDLQSYLQLLPKLYKNNLMPLIKKAMNIFLSQGIYTISEDAFLELHKNTYHNGLTFYISIVEAVEQTSAKNQAAIASLTSFVPNLIGGGFGLAGAAKGIAAATAFNLVRDGIESSMISTVSNINVEQQRELFAQVDKSDLIQNIFYDYWGIFTSIIIVLNQNNKDIWAPKGCQEADNMFKNLSNPNFPQEKVLELILLLFSYNPHNSDYHRFLSSRFGDTDEVIALRNYFGVRI